MRRRWVIVLAAALPCILLVALCAVAAHEWWLIHSEQIAVIPRPQAGTGSAVAVPAGKLIPLIAGSGLLAATFAYAMLRRSTRALLAGYLALLLIVGAAAARRALEA